MHTGKFLWPVALTCAALIFCSAKLAFPMDVTLAWDANTEPDLKGYNIYYRPDSSGDGILATYDGTGAYEGDSPIEMLLGEDENSDAGTAQFTVTGLPDGQIYFFVVTAYDNEFPANESNPSNEVNTTSTPLDTTPPTISGVKATSTTDTTVVIEWTTDEASDSQVNYGTISGSYNCSQNNTNLVTSHSITLTSLTASTKYYFTVSSTDASKNVATSNELTFTTDSIDTHPPVLSNIQVSATETTASITWITDEPADSEVQFGTASTTWGNYPSTKMDANYVTTHSVSLSGLVGGTTYYFQVGSRDASGNGPTTSADGTFNTAPPPDTLSPSILEYPTIDHASNTIDITYSESNMQNAEEEVNYAFSPSLLFPTLGGSDDITYLSGNTYRLFLSSIPSYTVFTLTVENVTDQAGNLLNPKTVTLNDCDNDRMADDWETAYSVEDPNADPDGDGLSNLEEFSEITDPQVADTDGDSLPDGWEVTYGLNPLDSTGANGAEGDPDNDGLSNYQESLSNTNPLDAASTVTLSEPVIVETIPHDGAGIGDDYRVPVDGSFCARIESSAGINIEETDSVTFTIDDGTNASYQRNLGDDEVRVVKLAKDEDTKVSKLWAVYDHPRETNGGFPFESYVTVRVDVRDSTGLGEAQGTYNFRVESKIEHLEANDPMSLPYAVAVDLSDPGMDGIFYDAGVQVEGGDLRGAKMLYHSSERAKPRFGSMYELPTLTADETDKSNKLKTSDRSLPPKHSNAKIYRTEVEPVGSGMNLQPGTVFSTPVKLSIPCPGYDDVSMLNVFLYNGREWVLACDASGNVTEDGEGWMVPGSRVNHNFADDPVNDPSTIEIQVYHFSGAQAADLATNGEGVCFITTAAGECSFRGHRALAVMLGDVTVLVLQFGKALVGATAVGAVFFFGLYFIRRQP
jgi:hypothetical protein